MNGTNLMMMMLLMLIADEGEMTEENEHNMM